MDRIYSFGCKRLIADRTGLGSTTLHYLAARQAMMSVHRSVTFENLARLPDNLTTVYTPRRMAFKVLLKHQGSLFLRFA